MTDMQVYDKAKWHYEGKHYPEKLPEIHAYTHGGFVLAWLLQRGLLSASFLEDHQAAIEKYNAGKITAGQLYELVDGVLDSDMLTDLGNEFAEDYFEESFFEDYEMLFEDDFDEIYAVADNKKCLKMACEMLDCVFDEWKDDRDDD